MEVNVIFQNTAAVDQNNNFEVAFKNEEEIIELLFNQKRDYYITNLITFIENEISYSKVIKDLEVIAKKHLDEEKKNVLETLASNLVAINYNPDRNLYNLKYLPFWNYYLIKDNMNLYQKEFKYLNTEIGKIEKFEAYNLLQHFKHGLIYGNPQPQRSVQNPVKNIIFKFINENVMWVSFNYTQSQKFCRDSCKWVNTIVMKDNATWITSDSEWAVKYKNILFNNAKNEDRNVKLRKMMADYYFKL